MAVLGHHTAVPACSSNRRKNTIPFRVINPTLHLVNIYRRTNLDNFSAYAERPVVSIIDTPVGRKINASSTSQSTDE
jgi:hypothetical protein